ncbi:MAG: hypothetical protein JWM14_192 [Chitinophagaceae bacterium]|nr:hypothetical protein [Chitinophagaceae bacterium]
MHLQLRLSVCFLLKLTKIAVLIVALLVSSSSMAQVAGDYRSKASGNWSDFTTWQVYDGSVWQNAIAGQVPAGTSEADANSVYLEAGFTVTLTNDAACKDLHLNGNQDVVRLNTQNFALNIWGKMRSYTGVAPGTTDFGSAGSGIAGWINTNTSGRLRLKGTVDRTVFVTNELTANSRTAGWRLDFAFDNGVTGYCKNTIRCGHLEVTSGILDTRGVVDGELADYEIRVAGNDYTAQPGNGVSGGTVIVRTGATLKSNKIHKNLPTTVGNSLASFIVEEGAVYVAKGSNQVPTLSYDIRGEVRFDASTAQNLIGTNGNVDAVLIVNYTDITLAGAGAKSLANTIAVSGKMVIEGTATLTPVSYSVSYGSDATLHYKGSGLQTTTNAEFPSANGPTNLIINNSNGVKLHATRSINGTLTLTNGLFDLQNNHFTLGENSPAIAGLPSVSNMVVTSGSGELRKIFNAPGYFFFPVGETTGNTEYSYARIDVDNGDVLSASTYVGVRVIDNVHPAANGVAIDDLSRYWSVSSNITNLTYDVIMQYLPIDVTGIEQDINAYNYGDETPLASGVPIIRINDVLHRIAVSGITSTGFITGANFCSISGNSISYSDALELCGAASMNEITGSSAVVSSTIPVYQWEQKVNSGSWNTISPNGDGTNYTDPSSLAPTNMYYYRRVVSDPVSCLATDVNYSNEIVFNVYESISGNVIGDDQILSDILPPDPFVGVATLAGGNDLYTYYWRVSDNPGGPYTDITSANSDTYTANGLTQSAFFVRKVESGVCSSVSNEVSITIVTGTTASDLLSDINVYPNPASELVYLDLGTKKHGDTKIVIVNNQGVALQEENFTAGESLLAVNMNNRTSGLYYLQVTIDGKYAATYKVSKR